MKPRKGPWAWPASRVTPEMMRAMHGVRERSSPRKPISVLLADAVQGRYGVIQFPETNPPPLEAA